MFLAHAARLLLTSLNARTNSADFLTASTTQRVRHPQNQKHPQNREQRLGHPPLCRGSRRGVGRRELLHIARAAAQRASHLQGLEIGRVGDNFLPRVGPPKQLFASPIAEHEVPPVNGEF